MKTRHAAVAGIVLALAGHHALQGNPSAAVHACTPPYPPSPVIRSITWDFAHLIRKAHGSDLWPTTWAGDGRIDTGWGDGGGFDGDSDDIGRVSLGFARISGLPPGITGKNVWGDKRGGYALHQATFLGKPEGMLAVGGVLYVWISSWFNVPEKPNDAPEPWGPWTTDAYYDNWGEFGARESPLWSFPAKWISADGKTMWCVFSGGRLRPTDSLLDSCNLVEATLTLKRALAAPMAPGPDPDMLAIHQLFAHPQAIRRRATLLPYGVETVTEASDAKGASLLQAHVAAPKLRLLRHVAHHHSRSCFSPRSPPQTRPGLWPDRSRLSGPRKWCSPHR